MLSIAALVLTAVWVIIVSVILALFGRTAGGAWSIAGGVARGVRDWAGHRSDRPNLSSPTSAPSPSPSTSPSPRAEVEEL